MSPVWMPSSRIAGTTPAGSRVEREPAVAGGAQGCARRDGAFAWQPVGLVAVRWLIDGMNVIGTRPDAWWKDRHAAMIRLVDLLQRFAASSGEEVTVVFEQR